MKPINNLEILLEELSKNYKRPISFGIARIDYGKLNTTKALQANFVSVNYQENYEIAYLFMYLLKEQGIDLNFEKSEELISINKDFIKDALSVLSPFFEKNKNIEVLKALNDIKEEKPINKDEYKIVFIFEDIPPKSLEVVYLKLYLLSSLKVRPREINLDGAFSKLPNLAWVDNKPIELDYLRENEITLKLRGEFPNIDYIDKFPRYLHHIIPSDNTRILDSSKVRFGAYLSAGTVVMPGASYINFNSGTLGSCMVEGRISSSALIGEGSDIGGGASILGVLSGTDGRAISIGENSLLGANSVLGISLGNACIVDAGLSILEGSKVKILDIDSLKEVNKNFNLSGVVKARELANLNGLHFRKDSQSGSLIVKRSTREIKLNDELH